jgi:hypothetical protein
MYGVIYFKFSNKLNFLFSVENFNTGIKITNISVLRNDTCQCVCTFILFTGVTVPDIHYKLNTY